MPWHIFRSSTCCIVILIVVPKNVDPEFQTSLLPCKEHVPYNGSCLVKRVSQIKYVTNLSLPL